MPIYAYRCGSCGHAKDVLQKMSDPRLTTCPACGADTFSKQVTAAGFQLKGSGWYQTDFKGSGSAAPAAAAATAPAAATSGGSDSAASSDSGSSSSGSDSSASGGCGTACPCH
jgi:putative FmdB family regulatory protein